MITRIGALSLFALLALVGCEAGEMFQINRNDQDATLAVVPAQADVCGADGMVEDGSEGSEDFGKNEVDTECTPFLYCGAQLSCADSDPAPVETDASQSVFAASRTYIFHLVDSGTLAGLVELVATSRDAQGKIIARKVVKVEPGRARIGPRSFRAFVDLDRPLTGYTAWEFRYATGRGGYSKVKVSRAFLKNGFWNMKLTVLGKGWK